MTTEFLEGDLVEAVKGEEVFRARAVLYPKRSGKLYLSGIFVFESLDRFEEKGFTLTLIERPKPKVELPSEPGYYECEKYPLAQGYSAYRLTNNGIWRSGTEDLALYYMEGLGKLTRLESRADTAKAVLTALNECAIQTVGRDEPHRIIWHEWWNKVAAEFGVTDA